MLFQPEPLRPRPALAMELWGFCGRDLGLLPHAFAWFDVRNPAEVEDLMHLVHILRRHA